MRELSALLASTLGGASLALLLRRLWRFRFAMKGAGSKEPLAPRATAQKSLLNLLRVRSFNFWRKWASRALNQRFLCYQSESVSCGCEEQRLIAHTSGPTVWGSFEPLEPQLHRKTQNSCLPSKPCPEQMQESCRVSIAELISVLVQEGIRAVADRSSLPTALEHLDARI